jgi:hypothetical protein
VSGQRIGSAAQDRIWNQKARQIGEINSELVRAIDPLAQRLGKRAPPDPA